MAAARPAAVPATRRHRDPADLRRHRPQHAQRRAGRTGLTDAAGQPLISTRMTSGGMFITDAILHGMPPHIAQLVAGHHDINVTLGYKAAFPEEVISSHLAFLARPPRSAPG